MSEKIELLPYIAKGFVIIAAIFVLLSFTKIEIQAEGTCNTGFVGLDIEAYNNIQNMSCSLSLYENNTCFKQDTLLKHIKVKNIDGMNCYGKTNIKMPFILALFMD